jgi:2-polyprenyl-3-methyl-5-hydroxy-6-metoxy-1,4-benzoquinol methylase
VCYAEIVEQNVSVDHVLTNVRSHIKNEYERAYFDLHEGRYRFTLQKITTLQLSPHARILDVGCYPPHLLKTLRRLGYRVSGIASHHEPINDPDVVVLNIEKDRLPHRSRSFDLVLFSEIIEHLVVDPRVYLSEIRRVLTPQGRLLITTPNAAGLHKLIPILFSRSTYFPLEQLFATKLEGGSLYHRHNREFTMSELKEVLEKSNFQVTTTEYVSAYKKKSHLQHPNDGFVRSIARTLAYLLMDVFPTRRDTLYVEVSPK